MSHEADPGHDADRAVEFMLHDHEEAVRLLERIVENLAASTSEENPELRRDLRDFIEHTRAHFNREESLMKEVGYPPLPVHKQEHDQRLEELVSFLDDLDAGVVSLNELRELFMGRFLPWYRRHCATMDAATEKFVKGQGRGSEPS
ncbi:hemerythrin [Thioalkalivibrio denitrificans]|uniref:Hemerythrin n=1 Tax=Thioalkalivibrio denitrificans TaxID=108003 RepID=A0A1V3NIH5_9GAMM|nr:hemerythrin family protein [Thioalkalivibrio denitrificans]OOG24566.1 hemerythrin [Thioalkalivibrio denitrificans]